MSVAKLMLFATIEAAIVAAAEPSMEAFPDKTPPKLKVIGAAHSEAVEALPVSEAVIVPAEKFPLPSRTTIALFVFVDATDANFAVAIEPAS